MMSIKKDIVLVKPSALVIEIAVALAIFAVAALPFYLQIPNDLIASRDEYKHLLIARSIASGNGLNPPTPVPIQYPPGWGATLCFTAHLLGDRLEAAHVLTSLLAWLTGPLVFVYLRSRIRPILALGIGGLTSVHILSIRLGDTLLSEPIFGVTWFACLLLLRRPLALRYHGWLFAGALIALCMSFRTIGISLWVGTICYLALNYKAKLRLRLLYIMCLSIVPILYLGSLNTIQPSMGIRPDRGYGSQFLRVRMP